MECRRASRTPTKKLLSAEETEQLLGQLRESINAVLQSLSQRTQAVNRIIQYSQSLKPPVEKAALAAYLKHIAWAMVLEYRAEQGMQ